MHFRPAALPADSLRTSVVIDGYLRPVLVVTKMRGSGHTREFRQYELTPHGAVVGAPLAGYEGITTGVPTLTLRAGA